MKALIDLDPGAKVDLAEKEAGNSRDLVRRSN